MVRLLPFRNNLGPAGYIILLQLIIIGFFGLLFIGSQLQSIDIKQIVLQANETAEDTNTILGSGNRTGIIINEIRNISNDISKNFTIAELSRQNQTAELLPVFFRSFNQTDKVEDIAQELVELLAQQRFTEKEIRDNIVQLTFDVDRLVSVTDRLANQSLN